jgi:ferredoxin--NADP+ reductase
MTRPIGKSEFACVDGPEFDAHTVDFQILSQRNSMYREQEQQAFAMWKEKCAAHDSGGHVHA